MVALIDRPSPNHNGRPERDGEPRSPDLLVLHYTGMQTGEAALEGCAIRPQRFRPTI